NLADFIPGCRLQDFQVGRCGASLLSRFLGRLLSSLFLSKQRQEQQQRNSNNAHLVQLTPPRCTRSRLAWFRFDAEQLPDRVAALDFEAGLFQHLINLRFSEEVHGAALDVLQPDLANGHSPSPKAWPSRQEFFLGQRTYKSETLGWFHD